MKKGRKNCRGQMDPEHSKNTAYRINQAWLKRAKKNLKGEEDVVRMYYMIDK